MVDIPGNSSTTATISVGGTVSGTLETLGDHDWFRITLTAGQAITVFVDGTTLEDPYLYIRNSAGQLLFENDDISSGTNRDSRVSFTAPSTGTYYIDVGAWNEGYTGNYQVSVSVYTPPPVATYDQIANQLTHGYWGGDDHHFNVGPGGSITVNLTALTPAGQSLAREALNLWSDVIGVQFVEVGGTAQITFDDNQEGAFSDSNWANGIISTAIVNVSAQWLADYGTALNSYSFQTYVHEIGHALGLGHAGNYNGSANYPYDASFQNDAWATSIMSYFSQTENTYFAGQGFTEEFVVTPMMADIIAMSNLYGLSATTRTGNTTYGFNSTAGRDVFNSSLNPGVAYTIFDSGGIDTLDYSGFGTNQLINLNAETFSNVGTRVGNVSIARGVTIENAIGGSGNDSLVGNAAANVLTGNNGNDILNGGAGADTLIGGFGNDQFIVDQAGDVVSEIVGQGEDIVVAKASYTLVAGASIETMTTVNASATTAINLTGNELAQSLYGNAGNNILTGMGGSDYLVGLGGNDQYYVDVSDYIAESIGGGDDSILVATSYALRDGNEIETLVAVNQASFDPVNLTGNEFGQSLYGSQGVNSLNGGGGNDFLVGLGGNDFLLGGAGNDNMAGGAGNDVYYVDGGDWVIEATGEGDDLVVAFDSFALRAGESVETLSAGGSAAINLAGNELAQSLYGNAGNNILTGMGGSDYLVGGGGSDTFVLANAPGVATIGDYSSGEVVDISQILSVANGTDLVGGGYLRVTSGGQLQIDSNGAGDSWTTLANVSGSSPVTVRYLAGGNLTNTSVSRSTSQTSAMAAAAAAGMAVLPLDPKAPEDSATSSQAGDDSQHAPTIVGGTELASADISGALLSDDSSVAQINGMTSSSNVIAKEALPLSEEPSAAVYQPALSTASAVDGGPASSVPGGTPDVGPLTAHGIAMPSAKMLLADGQGHVDASASDGALATAEVARALLDSLQDGMGQAGFDALFDALPVQEAIGSGVTADSLLGQSFAMAAAVLPNDALSFEMLATHPDALPAA